MNPVSTARTLAAAALLSAAALFAPAPALADDQRLDAAWKAALEDPEGVLTEKEHALANSIAYHAAAARLCDGIDLDTDKAGAAVNAMAVGADSLTDDERLARLSHILVMLGTAKGIFLAEGALHADTFCKDAMAAKADTENQHFWK